ncbi:MAG: hypothetical protein AAF468_03390 [Pseudomonadota bacterium]
MTDSNTSPNPNPSLAEKFKRRSKEAATFMGAVAILIPVGGKILDEGKLVACKHFIDCSVSSKPENQNRSDEIYSEKSIVEHESEFLGISIKYPIGLLSLDDTKQQMGKLHLVDKEQNTRVIISRIPRKINQGVIEEREKEAKTLSDSGQLITYKAPEKSENISNWYVISGIVDGDVFYTRRYFVRNEIISYEVRFPKSDQENMCNLSIYYEMNSNLIRNMIFMLFFSRHIFTSEITERMQSH